VWGVMEQPNLELDPGITGTAGGRRDGNTMSSTGSDLTMDDKDEH
jgi:hypothetical protein